MAAHGPVTPDAPQGVITPAVAATSVVPTPGSPSWQNVVLIIAPVMIAALVSAFTSYLAYAQAKEANSASQNAVVKVKETHDLVNSRLSEMLPLLKAGAADRATLEERAAQRKTTDAVEAAVAKDRKK